MENFSNAFRKLNRNLNKLYHPQPKESTASTLLYAVVIMAIIVFLMAILFHYVFQRRLDKALDELSQKETQKVVIKEPKAKITTGVPTKYGAPVSIEYGGNIAGNPYLNLWGDGMDASGYARYPDRRGRRRRFVYYPDDKLSRYVQEQNQYIRQVNRRIREINNSRMYSQKFNRHRAELAELRGFERQLANEVHREAKKQPYLPDQNNYY